MNCSVCNTELTAPYGWGKPVSQNDETWLVPFTHLTCGTAYPCVIPPSGNPAS